MDILISLLAAIIVLIVCTTNKRTDLSLAGFLLCIIFGGVFSFWVAIIFCIVICVNAAQKPGENEKETQQNPPIFQQSNSNVFLHTPQKNSNETIPKNSEEVSPSSYDTYPTDSAENTLYPNSLGSLQSVMSTLREYLDEPLNQQYEQYTDLNNDISNRAQTQSNSIYPPLSMNASPLMAPPIPTFSESAVTPSISDHDSLNIQKPATAPPAPKISLSDPILYTKQSLINEEHETDIPLSTSFVPTMENLEKNFDGVEENISVESSATATPSISTTNSLESAPLSSTFSISTHNANSATVRSSSYSANHLTVSSDVTVSSTTENMPSNEAPSHSSTFYTNNTYSGNSNTSPTLFTAPEFTRPTFSSSLDEPSFAKPSYSTPSYYKPSYSAEEYTPSIPDAPKIPDPPAIPDVSIQNENSKPSS